MKLSLLALFALALPLAAAPAAKLPYTYTRVGNPADVTPVAPLQSGVAMIGGAVDVDYAFQWMSARAQNGDFLVIRATGSDGYNAYIQGICPGANSAATLVIPTITAANDSRVADLIAKAEAIFIAGGDQSNYINFWKGTKVQTALNARIVAGVPVGGTSAGLDVLTQFVYSAQESKGVTSAQALANPFTRYLTLDRDFIAVPSLVNTLGDAHFGARDRMGRNVAFLARLYVAGWTNRPRGIAVDEATVLLIDPATATGSVVGSGAVYCLQGPGAPEVCVAGSPLTYRNVNVYRLRPGATLNLTTWVGSGGVAYQVSANAGVLTSTQAGGSAY